MQYVNSFVCFVRSSYHKIALLCLAPQSGPLVPSLQLDIARRNDDAPRTPHRAPGGLLASFRDKKMAFAQFDYEGQYLDATTGKSLLVGWLGWRCFL